MSSRPDPGPGYRTVGSYAVVPSARSARYLLPLGSRATAARALHAYGGLRPPRRRAARFAAALAVRVGAGQAALRDRLYVHVARDAPADELAELSLLHHLAAVLQLPQVDGLISLGGSGPYAKPVVHVVSTDGRPVAFVKVGWNPISADLVANEARMLERCRERAPKSFRAPQLLHAGEWNELKLSVAAPLPHDVRRFTAEAPPAAHVTREVGALSESAVQPLWDSAFARRLHGRLDGAAGRAPAGDPLTDLLPWLRRRFAEPRLCIGAWHGDWVPWNLATRREDLYVWDWEHGGDAVPLGFDAIHFHFQSAVIRDGLDVAEGVRRARDRASASLRLLDVPDSLAGLVLTLYLTEVALRTREVARAGGVPNPVLARGVTEALRASQELG